MVNGKPNLTFTGAAPVSDAKARQRAYTGGRNADNGFASFLPAEAGKNENAAGTPARRFVPQQPASPAALAHPAPAVPATPAGQQARAEARILSQPGLQGLLPQNTAMQPHQAQRVAKSAPRVSGTPITGRNHIGMVDTRKTGGQENPQVSQNAARPAFTPAKLAASRAPSPEQPDSAFNNYAALIGNLTGTPVGVNSPQSFVSHGFSGTSAVLAMKKLGYDVHEAQSITTQARKLEPDPYDLNRTAPPMSNAAGRNNKQDARGRAANRMQAADPLPAGAYPEHSLVSGFYNAAVHPEGGLGRLAAKFESGSEGIAAIGYDRKGGTSYGKYQIASKVGTMDAFISYLQDKAPDLAGRLVAAGPANTGGKNGKMPVEWRAIAAEQPGRFEQLQEDFIRLSHLEPAMRGVANATGLAFEKMPTALQEVLFSTAVQHGPSGATRIISQAVERVGAQKLQIGEDKKSAPAKKAEEQLITQIYNLRAGQFGSSTDQVQAAVRNRLRQEMREAIQMLA